MEFFTAIILPGDRKAREITPEGVTEYINTARPGIYVFRKKGMKAVPERVAESHERTEVFDAWQLPQVTVLPVVQTSHWLCLPTQRNQYKPHVKANAPLPLLFAPKLSIFDPVLARVYKHRRTWLLYEDVNERFPSEQIAQLRIALDSWGKRGMYAVAGVAAHLCLSPEFHDALEVAKATTELPIERMAKYALHLANASFESLKPVGNGQFQVTYRYDEKPDTVLIDDALTVIDSGICLEGRDSDFDLTSIVFVKHKRRDMDE